MKEITKSIFPYWAGKEKIAKKIAEYIPEHSLYVEPFAGAASVFFLKQKVMPTKAVLNDIDPEVAFMLKFIKQLTPEVQEKLNALDWSPSPAKWKQLKALTPANELERFHKFFYVHACSFANRGASFTKDKTSARRLKNRVSSLLRRWTPQLKDAEILRADALEVIKRYNGKDTFFYFDPPYYGDYGDMKVEAKFDFDDLLVFLVKLEGKFIFSWKHSGKEARILKENFHTKIFKVKRIAREPTGGGTPDKELIAANYPLKRQRIIKVVKVTREQQREELERLIGDWYMLKENGKHHPYVIQYHNRGLWYESERENISRQIDKLELKERNAYLKREKALYLTTSEEELAKDAQAADDKRGDVSAAIKKHLTDNFPEEMDKSRVVNLGNVHIDFRMLEPDGEFLVGWTFHIPKSVLQHLDGKLFYPLRDRFLNYKDGDQWTANKKATQPLSWLNIVNKRKPYVERKPREIGATEETTGIFELKQTGYVYFGVQKSDFHEYWLFPEGEKSGKRLDVKLVPGSKLYRKAPEREFWMGAYPFTEKGKKPYILTHDREREEAKAKRDKIELIWNEKLIDLLKLKKQAAYISFKKFDEELKIAAGPVVIPGQVDRQGQRISKEELAKAVYDWSENKRELTLQHKRGSVSKSQIVPVEVFIFPEREILNRYPEGTFWLGVKFRDDNLWNAAKQGKLHAFSIGGKSRFKESPA